jgi:hypothetical protein
MNLGIFFGLYHTLYLDAPLHDIFLSLLLAPELLFSFTIHAANFTAGHACTVVDGSYKLSQGLQTRRPQGRIVT